MALTSKKGLIRLWQNITTCKEQSMEDTCLTICYSFPEFKEMIDAKHKILELVKGIRFIGLSSENGEELLALNSKELITKEFI